MSTLLIYFNLRFLVLFNTIELFYLIITFYDQWIKYYKLKYRLFILLIYNLLYCWLRVQKSLSQYIKNELFPFSAHFYSIYALEFLPWLRFTSKVRWNQWNLGPKKQLNRISERKKPLNETNNNVAFSQTLIRWEKSQTNSKNHQKLLP